MRRLCLALAVLLLPTLLQAQDFPPPLAGDVLAYTDSAGDGVHLYELQTGLTRTLRIGEGTHHVWDFSPDGCRVLVTLTSEDTPSRLYNAELDGAGVRELVDFSELPPAAWTMWEADWSPTADMVAFTLARPTEAGRESRVAWVPAAGGAPTFYSVAGDEHTPRWSPDGNWLAYISYEDRPAGETPFTTAVPDQAAGAPTLREADLWMVSANGLTKERITRFDVGSAAQPRWNPDSDLLGFVFSPSPGENQFWMIAAVPEAIPTQLSYQWNQTLDFTWHPDGTTMVAAVRGLQGVNEARLWAVPLAGNADEDATLLTMVPEDTVGVDFPRFNGAGTHLALRHNYQLVLVNVETQAVTSLGSYGNTPPVWNPPGFVGEAACASG